MSTDKPSAPPPAEFQSPDKLQRAIDLRWLRCQSLSMVYLRQEANQLNRTTDPQMSESFMRRLGREALTRFVLERTFGMASTADYYISPLHAQAVLELSQ